MERKFRSWPTRLFEFFTIAIAVLYLLACLVVFLDPGIYWFVALLGLGFPFLFATLILCLLIWLIKRSRKWSLSLLIVLLIGWQQISVVFGLNFFQAPYKIEKDAETIRVLSWNVSRWDEPNKDARGGTSYRPLMMDAIYLESPDILCLQEFFEPYVMGAFEKNIEALAKMGYPYYYFFPSSSIWDGVMKFGIAIFSRYPIIDSGKLSFGNTIHSEGLAYVDVFANKKRVRVFTFHMESLRLGKLGYFEADNPREAAGRLRRAYMLRTYQAELVHEQIRKSPYPVIVCGNIGDLPNSYAYFKVRDDLNDVFIKKGAGLGATFRFFSPTLRVEYIFASKDFEILQYKRPDLIYSDHYPLVTDLRLQ